MNRIDLWKLLLLVLPLSLTLSVKALAEDAPEAPEPATEEVAEQTSDTDEDSDGGEGQEGEEEEEKPKTIAELTEEMDRVVGLFTMFRDPKTGATKMLLQGDQLDSEFIYFKHTMNGVTDAGAFTGLMAISTFSRSSVASISCSLSPEHRVLLRPRKCDFSRFGSEYLALFSRSPPLRPRTRRPARC